MNGATVHGKHTDFSQITKYKPNKYIHVYKLYLLKKTTLFISNKKCMMHIIYQPDKNNNNLIPFQVYMK